MNKILIIGQAPPYNKQELPYDSTMLYKWLESAGVSKEAAQEIFEFEAVFDKFPGFDESGGHKKPTKDQISEYWYRVLSDKFLNAEKVWILGRVAEEHIRSTFIFNNFPKKDKDLLITMHPSTRNYAAFKKQEKEIIQSIITFLES